MAEIKMGVVESHFADIIWANEPLHSRDLVKLFLSYRASLTLIIITSITLSLIRTVAARIMANNKMQINNVFL